ncbi:MAG: UDP-N-acetylmuramoyl-L-alanine--D-glutamate ligase [Anaerolineae bacterium]|nr:UDP-N-acetylmuramoyl-L-alanine--D-glutamate ligase [Thermoflexales bacterium]MDW8395635.1 UDP-N-acetylmuramoyl-L-alanine--D-glutamate ligase [Anaerolineae bacterium]
MIESWHDQQVLILGAARQGKALARYLLAQGARVTLNDAKPVQALELDDLAELEGLNVVGGGHPLGLLDGCTLVCVSGGVPLDLPIVREAQRRGIPLTNDAQLFIERCPAPVVGITGSAGKTTTTTLVGEMLKQAGQRVWVGGNIGNPLITDLAHIQADDVVVMELSSFQLELMTRSPHIACITNITPNHLDRHGTMEAYVAAKRRILDFQSPSDWRVLCADNPITVQMGKPERTVWFSAHPLPPDQEGAWLDAGRTLRLRLHGQEQVIAHRNDLKLMGEHNILNVLAASAISVLAGAPIEAVRTVATSFRGVAHRLELVSERGGVRWYDDSIATAPERLIAALNSFEQPVILLCGGRDKHLPWDEAARLMRARCKAIVLFGEMGPMVAEHLRAAAGEAPWVITPSLREAVRAAQQIAQPGDVVLLSPGGTSYDEFKDFAERGDKFRQWVNEQW